MSKKTINTVQSYAASEEDAIRNYAAGAQA